MTVAVTVQCPECAGAVPVSDELMVAEIVICQHCSSELEVVAMDGRRVAAVRVIRNLGSGNGRTSEQRQ